MSNREAIDKFQADFSRERRTCGVNDMLKSPKGPNHYYPQEFGMIEERFHTIGHYSTPSRVFIYRPRGWDYIMGEKNAPLVLTPPTGASFTRMVPFLNTEGLNHPDNLIPVRRICLANGEEAPIHYPSGDEWMFSRSGVVVTMPTREGVVQTIRLYFVHGSDITQADSYGIIIERVSSKRTSERDIIYYSHNHGREDIRHIPIG